MGTYKRTEGQTLIETAVILFLLLLILLGITEFSRAWYTKNSLKNAARSGARVAVVTPAPITTSFTCTNDTACPNSDPVRNAVCCQPGVKPKTGEPAITVTITCNDGACSTTSIPAGTTVKVAVVFNNPTFFIVGGGMWPWSKGLTMTTDASMRYE